MPHRVYSEINLHITWHTKNSLPIINSKIENELYTFIKTKVLGTDETFFHAIGGIENHVHLAVSVPSNLEIANWIGKLKGASSFFINKRIANRKVLQWQNGYGVVSFGTRDLDWVKRYVLNQKERHRSGRTHGRLETYDHENIA